MNKSKFGAILASSFALAMSPAAGRYSIVQPERWVHVGGSANLHEDYLDQESIAALGDRVTVWTRRESMLGKSTEWYELEFDCSMRTVTILAHVRNDRGIISHSVARPHRAASPVHLGSVDDRSFKIVCRQSRPDKRPIFASLVEAEQDEGQQKVCAGARESVSRLACSTGEEE